MDLTDVRSIYLCSIFSPILVQYLALGLPSIVLAHNSIIAIKLIHTFFTYCMDNVKFTLSHNPVIQQKVQILGRKKYVLLFDSKVFCLF